MRGSKLCGQNDVEKTPAPIMTRPQANGYKQFVTKRRELPTLNVQTSETRKLKSALQPNA